MEKKGSELSLNFIIIAVLAIIVLIGIVFFFLGGAEFFAQKRTGTVVLTEQDRSIAEAACNLNCAIGNKEKWNNPSFPESVKKAGYGNCDALMATAPEPKSWEANCKDNA